jgi:hypothetical protein
MCCTLRVFVPRVQPHTHKWGLVAGKYTHRLSVYSKWVIFSAKLYTQEVTDIISSRSFQNCKILKSRDKCYNDVWWCAGFLAREIISKLTTILCDVGQHSEISPSAHVRSFEFWTHDSVDDHISPRQHFYCHDSLVSIFSTVVKYNNSLQWGGFEIFS